MTSPPEPEIELTLAIRELSGGSVQAEAAVLEMLVRELRSIAGGYARQQRDGHTLQATALVNEAFLKLLGNAGLAEVQDRQHFFRIAARAMRQILIDHARNRTAAKRGGYEHAEVTLNEELVGSSPEGQELLDVDEALDELAALDPEQARLVELRFFAGLEVVDVADILGVSKSTVEREWRAARAWLGQRIEEKRQA